MKGIQNIRKQISSGYVIDSEIHNLRSVFAETVLPEPFLRKRNRPVEMDTGWDVVRYPIARRIRV